jgi:hypothetical protein
MSLDKSQSVLWEYPLLTIVMMRTLQPPDALGPLGTSRRPQQALGQVHLRPGVNVWVLEPEEPPVVNLTEPPEGTIQSQPQKVRETSLTTVKIVA